MMHSKYFVLMSVFMAMSVTTAFGGASNKCIQERDTKCPICLSEAGYCTDYVKSKGFKVSGDAIKWCKNGTQVAAKDVVAGNAVVINVKGSSFGHVAYIESIDKTGKMTLSEYNWGAKNLNTTCAITDKFKERTTRTLAKTDGSIACFIRK